MSDIAFNLLLNGGVGSGLTRAFGSVGQKVKGLQSDLKSLNKTTAKIDQFKKVNSQLKQFKADMAGGGVAGERARVKFEKTSQTVAALSKELKQAGVNMNNLAGAEKRLGAYSDRLNRKLSKQQSVAARQQKAQARYDRSRNMRQSAFTGGMLGLAAPVMAVAAPIRAAVKYEEVMADVKKVTNLSAKDFKQLQNDVLEMSTKIPMSAEGLGNIIAAAGQSGIAKTKPELLAFAKTAAKMGVAFDVSGAKAGNIMADWRSGMGLTQKASNELADQVNELSNNFNTSAVDLAEIIQRQGAVAMTAGLTKEEVAAVGAAMKAGGARTEVAATSLKNFTNALTKGRMHSDAAQDAFKDMGLDVEQVAKGMQKDAQGTILSVIQAIKDKVPKHEISAVVGKIFGEESKGAIMPLIKNTKLLKDAFEIVGDRTKWSGSMLKEYEERYKTTANSIDLFKNRLNALSVTAGAIMLPTFNQVLGAVGGVSDKVYKMAKAHPEAAKKIVGGTAGLLGGLVGWKAAAAGTKWVAGGLGEIYNKLNKINALQMFKRKKIWGYGMLGALGAAAYAANELGMLEPMGKGFAKEFKKGSKDLLADINEIRKEWSQIIDGKAVKDMQNWEDIGRVIGEAAGEGLLGSLKLWVNTGKWLGNVAAAISLSDWDQVKALTIQPIEDILNGALIGDIGEEEYLRRQQAKAKQRKEKQEGTYKSHAFENLNASTLGDMLHTVASTFSPVPERDVNPPAEDESSPVTFGGKLLNTTVEQLSHDLVSAAAPYGLKPFETINQPYSWADWKKGFSDWGAQIVESIRTHHNFDPETWEADFKRQLEAGTIQPTEMSILPSLGNKEKAPTNKVTVPISVPPEIAAQNKKPRSSVDASRELEQLKTLNETVKGLSSEFDDQCSKIKESFRDLRLEASSTATKITGSFDGTGFNIREQLTRYFKLTETEFKLFQTNIDSVASDVKRSFENVAGAAKGIKSELSAAKTEAKGLADALKDVATAKSHTGGTTGGKSVDIPGRAGGGPMRSGRPYMVGENGPELVFPRRPGWVAHNRLTRNILGGFLNSGVSGLFHSMNPFRGAAFGGLSGGSISGSIFEAFLQQLTAPTSSKSSSKGPGIGTIHFSPNITVSGNADPANIGQQVYQAAEQGVELIRKQIEALWNDERRVDYGC